MDGCLLTCEGEETCETCKKNGPVAYHGARYRVPFSPEFPHFKVSSLEYCLSFGSHNTWLSIFLLRQIPFNVRAISAKIIY